MSLVDFHWHFQLDLMSLVIVWLTESIVWATSQDLAVPVCSGSPLLIWLSAQADAALWRACSIPGVVAAFPSLMKLVRFLEEKAEPCMGTSAFFFVPQGGIVGGWCGSHSQLVAYICTEYPPAWLRAFSIMFFLILWVQSKCYAPHVTARETAFFWSWGKNGCERKEMKD